MFLHLRVSDYSDPSPKFYMLATVCKNLWSMEHFTREKPHLKLLFCFVATLLMCNQSMPSMKMMMMLFLTVAVNVTSYSAVTGRVWCIAAYIISLAGHN